MAKEAAEAEYWLELIRDSKSCRHPIAAPVLVCEANELVRIFAAALKTLRTESVEPIEN